jgi:hypothetical protein
MSSTGIRVAAAVLVTAGIAALIYLLNVSGKDSRREAYIHECNEEGAGGMITSREYCEELYNQSIGQSPARNSN